MTTDGDESSPSQSPDASNSNQETTESTSHNNVAADSENDHDNADRAVSSDSAGAGAVSAESAVGACTFETNQDGNEQSADNEILETAARESSQDNEDELKASSQQKLQPLETSSHSDERNQEHRPSQQKEEAQRGETNESRVASPGAFFSGGGKHPPPPHQRIKGGGAEQIPDQEHPDTLLQDALAKTDQQLNKTPATVAAVPPPPEEPNHTNDNNNIDVDRTIGDLSNGSSEVVENRAEQSSSSDIPMVQAELVVPPVEAFHVAIDAEIHAAPNDQEQGVRQILPMELEQAPHPSNATTSGAIRRLLQKKPCSGLLCVMVLLSLAIGLTIVIVLAVTSRSELGDDQPVLDGPSMSPTFGYPCFTSTLDILNAQRAIVETGESIPAAQSSGETYAICPDTTIEIGTFVNPSINDFNLVQGDYPLWVIRPNVTIQCGIDGKLKNNCTLTGGVLQFLTISFVPTTDMQDYHDFGVPLDNIMIRGITFTGQILNPAPIQGMSVVTSHSGTYRFEDCQWKDLFANTGVVGVFLNPPVNALFTSTFVVQDKTIDVTFSKCIFDNIVYDNPLIQALGQNVTLESCVFRDIRLSALAVPLGEDEQCGMNNIVFASSEEYGCAELLYCGSNSTCTVGDICLERVQSNGPGILVASSTGHVILEGPSVMALPEDVAAESSACDLTILGPDEDIDCIQIFEESQTMTCPIQP